MPFPKEAAYSAVLFDLDGTLVDTAPDMVAVLQDVQTAHGHDPIAYDLGRAHVSNGAVGLLRVGFPDRSVDFGSDLHLEYLARYEDRICIDSTLFAGLADVLGTLEGRGCPWGVVTNKPHRLTVPLLERLGLAERSACTVSGDTLEQRKPHPAPMLHACSIAGIEPARTIYVGDARRDIDAGLAAGMGTIAAAYGYVPDGDSPDDWGAHEIARIPEDLTHILGKAVNLQD